VTRPAADLMTEVYSNALLASLNARDIIRGHINDVDTNFKFQTYHPRSQFSREAVTARGQGTAGPTELAIQIERETELYGDKEYNKNECDRPEVWVPLSMSHCTFQFD
jgi:hypothetical protein